MYVEVNEENSPSHKMHPAAVSATIKGNFSSQLPRLHGGNHHTTVMRGTQLRSVNPSTQNMQSEIRYALEFQSF
jgi:hypothetical protein